MGVSFPVLFLVLVAAASQAAVSPKDYWQSKLPDAPMPAAIRDSLPSDEVVGVDGSSAAGRNIYQGGVRVEGLAAADIGRVRPTNLYQLNGVGVEGLAATDVGRARATNFYQKGVGVEGLVAADISRAGATNFYQKGVSVEGLAATNIGRARATNFYQLKRVGVERLAATNVGRAGVTNFYQKGVGVEGLADANIGKARATNFYQLKGVGIEGQAAADIGKTRATNFYQLKGVGVDGLAATDVGRAGATNFYKNGMNMKQRNKPVKQILAKSVGANFFLEKDLHPGAKIWLDFSRISPEKLFIPREAAISIPFSSDKLPHILDIFSVNPNCVEAEIMRMTLRGCENAKDSTEETKFCATSLESMFEYAITAHGTDDVVAVSTELSDDGATLAQEYAVAAAAAASPMQRLPGGHAVACHQQPYPYAVFYCHVTRATRAYTVPLVGVADGVRAVAVAVCHDDTSAWTPSHPAFQALKVAPGTVPVCHFLPQDSVIWAPKGEAILPSLSEN